MRPVPISRVLLLPLMICVCLLGSYGAAAEQAASDVDLDEVESAIVKQTNAFRERNELDGVVNNQHLTKAATEFAEFMAKSGKYGHRADGRTPAERAKAAGYEYCVVRENIAYRTNTGEVTVESLLDVFVQGWIDSPPHRENMLADYVTHTGVAVATTDGITYYAVQLFGRDKSAAFEIEISNRSEQAEVVIVAANDSEDEIELPPRGIVRMKRCFPTTVRLEGDDAGQTYSESVRLVIEDQQLQAASP